jgi:hypothetical protein
MHLEEFKKEGAMIHALRYTEELEKVGFTPEQAKKSVQLWMDLMDQNFATKADFKEHYFMTRSDMKDVESRLQADMKDLRSELQADMKDLRSELQADMKDMQFGLESKIHKLEQTLTVRLGIMMAASIGIVSTIVSFKH